MEFEGSFINGVMCPSGAKKWILRMVKNPVNFHRGETYIIYNKNYPNIIWRYYIFCQSIFNNKIRQIKFALIYTWMLNLIQYIVMSYM